MLEHPVEFAVETNLILFAIWILPTSGSTRCNLANVQCLKKKNREIAEMKAQLHRASDSRT
jgi:hypothetical protein